MLDGCAPDANEARDLLIELAEQTGLSRPLRARLIGVPSHSLRRWEDRTRKPDKAACRLIGLTCWAVRDLGPFELFKLMMEQSNKVAADRSRTAGEHLAALASIPQLCLAQAELCLQMMAVAEANDAAKKDSA